MKITGEPHEASQLQMRLYDARDRRLRRQRELDVDSKTGTEYRRNLGIGGVTKMSNSDGLTTRRAMLTAALGGAAAAAAHVALPASVLAHDPDDLRLGAVNTAPATTVLNSVALDADALIVRGANDNLGSGIVAVGARAPGLRAYSGVDAAVYAINGDETGAATQAQTVSTGVYGYTPASPDPSAVTGSGVWGDSPDIGVVGTGGLGVLGQGNLGVEGDGYGTGGIGVKGFAGGAGTVGVQAYAGSTDRTALQVTGKAVFSRSGRVTIVAGKSTYTKTLAGVSSSSLVFAVLSSSRSGRWVRAVVPAAGKFTIYLNTTVASSTNIVWWVLN